MRKLFIFILIAILAYIPIVVYNTYNDIQIYDTLQESQVEKDIKQYLNEHISSDSAKAEYAQFHTEAQALFNDFASIDTDKYSSDIKTYITYFNTGEFDKYVSEISDYEGKKNILGAYITDFFMVLDENGLTPQILQQEIEESERK